MTFHFFIIAATHRGRGYYDFVATILTVDFFVVKCIENKETKQALYSNKKYFKVT